MSAILNTKRAVERLVATLGIPVAYEGVSFSPPRELYLRTQLLVRSPEDPVIGDKYYRERITFQVFVADQLNLGTANALNRAEQVRALFPKGLTLMESGTRIYVLGTPQIAGTAVTADRLVVPIMIDLVAEVYV